MRDRTIARHQAIATIGLDWRNEGIGDFGGEDGTTCCGANSGQVSLWTMNGPTIVEDQSVATINFDWHNQGLGDFNADGTATCCGGTRPARW